LDYGIGERKLKVEISKRQWDNRYEIKNLLGINMQVMIAPDMFAHKLCAMFDREEVTNRDIFDSWFFMQKQTPINKDIIETRMAMPLADYSKHSVMPVFDSMISWSKKVDFQKPPKHSELMWNFQEFLLE
jgi:predicted nucleotidyltransferase component of viral defense system